MTYFSAFSAAQAVVCTGSVEVDADTGAPRRARGYVRAVMAEVGAPREVAEAAVLITSELVTNSVRHGRAGQVRVNVTTRGTRMRITGSDRPPYEPPPEGKGEPAGDAEGGRGPLLVAGLSEGWGHGCAGPGPRYGTAVWAELGWDGRGRPEC